MKTKVRFFFDAALALLLVAAVWPAQAQGMRAPGSGGGVSLPRAGGSAGSGVRAQPAATAPASPATAPTQGGAVIGPIRTPSLEVVPPPNLPAPIQSADYIVALVNSEPVTNNEVNERIRQVLPQMQGAALPPRSVMLEQVTDRLINERAQLQLAKELGIKIDPLALQQTEENVARQNEMTLEQLHERLRADAIPVEQFRTQLRNQLILSRLRDREVDSDVKVSEADIDQFLRDQKTAGQTQPGGESVLNLAQILVRVPENASPAQEAELQAKADDVARRARAGEDFTVLAAQYSDSAERTRGGEMGLRPQSQYPQIFLDNIGTTPAGGVVGPVRSPAGFHVLKVLQRDRSGANVVLQEHARHILLRSGPNLTERQAADQLLDYKHRIESKQDTFEDLAKRYSQDGSAASGGDLGWSSEGMFVPEFQEVVDRLQPGQISDPVISRYGVHLIQLLERREHKLTALEQRDAVRNKVREKKADEAYGTWVQEVRGRAFVELREPPS